MIPFTSEDFRDDLDKKEILGHIFFTDIILTERESMVLYFVQVEGRTYRDIGEIFYLSAPRISRIHAKALRKLRYPPFKKRLENLLIPV